jgi:hypothetical protein
VFEILRRLTGARHWTAFAYFPQLWKHGRIDPPAPGPPVS